MSKASRRKKENDIKAELPGELGHPLELELVSELDWSTYDILDVRGDVVMALRKDDGRIAFIQNVNFAEDIITGA